MGLKKGVEEHGEHSAPLHKLVVPRTPVWVLPLTWNSLEEEKKSHEAGEELHSGRSQLQHGGRATTPEPLSRRGGRAIALIGLWEQTRLSRGPWQWWLWKAMSTAWPLHTAKPEQWQRVTKASGEVPIPPHPVTGKAASQYWPTRRALSFSENFSWLILMIQFSWPDI